MAVAQKLKIKTDAATIEKMTSAYESLRLAIENNHRAQAAAQERIRGFKR